MKNSEIQFVATFLNKLNTNEMSVDGLTKLIEYQDKLEASFEVFGKAQKKIFDGKEILTQTNDKIQFDKNQELLDKKVDINTIELKKEEFLSSAKGIELNTIRVLLKLIY